ncbi:MAG: efflux RND transporter periplasmic adaptor subunit [Acidobacteriota bacterium]|nr:efflux RND transporter periplasmic adaptor subunit [Acidobacteriota bacterium]
MDIPREDAIRKRRIRRIIYTLAGLVAVVSVTLGVSRLKPAPPSVDKATVWQDTVKRGPMLLEVRGLGSLVPEEILVIPAPTDGRVARRLLLPGSHVNADTVLMELTNPEQEQATLDAEWQMKAAEAQYKSTKAELDSKLLDQKAQTATVQSDYTEARLNAERDVELAKRGLGSELNAKVTRAKAEALATRTDIEKQRLAVSAASAKAQLDEQQAKVEQLRAQWQLKKAQLASLHVRAGAEGVLQELSVEVGQRVAAGTPLAKVVQPTRLKAQLKIPETQAKDVIIGQSAAIDTRNGIIPGHVMRVDPSVVEGSVTVDVKLDAALPKGARPDLSVEGTIQIENLADVIYVGRPGFGQPNSTVGIFRVDESGNIASRVQVKLGRASVNSVEILSGLQPGDKVILSDMSQWDAFNRIKLE